MTDNAAVQAQDVDLSTVSDTFAQHLAGKLDAETIAAVQQDLLAATTRYPANGSIASLVFYLEFGVDIKNGGKSFRGRAGGVAFPGGGALFGDVYTDDIERLYRETKSFEFQATPVYTSLLFFNSAHKLLGHFQAGAVSIVTGLGGGTGSWK